MRLTWLGNAGFMLESEGVRVYIDPVLEPYGGPEEFAPADLILISHWHPGHGSMETIKRLRTDTTAVWGSHEVAARINACVPLAEGGMLDFRHIRVHGLPAYNPRMPRSGPPGIRQAHLRGDTVGFLLELEGKKLYFASDIGLIPELSDVVCDIALLPVGGTLTMNAREAARACDILSPKIAIPMHWGKIEGTHDDAALFAELAGKKTRVIIPEPGRPMAL